MKLVWKFIFIACIFLFMLTILVTLFCCYGKKVDNIDDAYREFQNNLNRSDIVISFTTMPDRLKSSHFQFNVCSMLRQTYRPKQMLINIPYTLKKTGVAYEIPSWLEKLSSQDSTIELVRCEDEGPATKFLPSLRRYEFSNPLQLIVVCDDDSEMPRRQIEMYQQAYKEHSGAVIAAGGNQFRHEYPFNVNNYINGNMYFGVGNGSHLNKVNVILGYTSYCIQPYMFNINELTNFVNANKSTYFVDDIVISAHLASRNIPRYVYSGLDVIRISKVESLYLRLQGDKESLGGHDNSDIGNDQVALEYFSTYFMNDF